MLNNTTAYYTIPQKGGEICMKGKIGYDARMKRYYVSWYHAPNKKTYKIWFYNGIPLDTKALAERLRANMQSDMDRGVFRIERYFEQRSEVEVFLDDWIRTVGPSLKPSTLANYKSNIEKHIKPFFQSSLAGLHEIDYMMLLQFAHSLDVESSTKYKVMRTLSTALKFAKKTNKLYSLPVFPSKQDLQMHDKPVIWIPESRQLKIIEAIPKEHQPIFWFLKYHMRRPSEACALLKGDYDHERLLFTIQHTFSAGRFVNSPKRGKYHYIPVVDDFLPVLGEMLDMQKKWGIISPFFFINPVGRTLEKHYTLKFLQVEWEKACHEVGEKITLYNGLKHSSVTQLMNEYGMNENEIAIALDCHIDTVRSYATAEISTRRNLLNKRKKVVDIKKYKK